MSTFHRHFLAILTVLAALLLGGCAVGQSTEAATQPDNSSATPPALVRAANNQITTEGHGVLAQAALTNTPTPFPTPTATPPQPRADTVVWWPSALWPPVESPANLALEVQISAFQDMLERTVQIRPRRLDGPGGIMSTLRTASLVAPAALPDVVLLPRESLEIAAETGLIYPLADLLPGTLTRDLYAQALQLGTVGETLYGVAYALDIDHVVYRDSVFSAPPTTFDAVLEADQRFAFTAAGGLSQMVLVQYVAAGGRLIGDDGRPVLDEEPLRAVLEFYEQAAAAGLADNDVLDFDSPMDYWDNFLSGALNLAQIDSSLYLTYQAVQSPASNVRVAPVPTRDGNGGTTLNGWMWVVTTADPERQARAVEFIGWMMRAENQAEMAHLTGQLPSQRPALRLAVDNNYYALVEELLTQGTVIRIESVSSAVANGLQTALAAVLNRTRSVEEAAAEALAAVQSAP